MKSPHVCIQSSLKRVGDPLDMNWSIHYYRRYLSACFVWKKQSPFMLTIILDFRQMKRVELELYKHFVQHAGMYNKMCDWNKGISASVPQQHGQGQLQDTCSFSGNHTAVTVQMINSSCGWALLDFLPSCEQESDVWSSLGKLAPSPSINPRPGRLPLLLISDQVQNARVMTHSFHPSEVVGSSWALLLSAAGQMVSPFFFFLSQSMMPSSIKVYAPV